MLSPRPMAVRRSTSFDRMSSAAYHHRDGTNQRATADWLTIIYFNFSLHHRGLLHHVRHRLSVGRCGRNLTTRVGTECSESGILDALQVTE